MSWSHTITTWSEEGEVVPTDRDLEIQFVRCRRLSEYYTGRGTDEEVIRWIRQTFARGSWARLSADLVERARA